VPDSKKIAKAVTLTKHIINQFFFPKFFKSSVISVTDGCLVSGFGAEECSQRHDRARFVVPDQSTLLASSKSFGGW